MASNWGLHCDNCWNKSLDLFLTSCRHIMCQSCIDVGKHLDIQCQKCRRKAGTIPISGTSVNVHRDFTVYAQHPLANFKNYQTVFEFQMKHIERYVNYLYEETKRHRNATATLHQEVKVLTDQKATLERQLQSLAADRKVNATRASEPPFSFSPISRVRQGPNASTPIVVPEGGYLHPFPAKKTPTPVMTLTRMKSTPPPATRTPTPQERFTFPGVEYSSAIPPIESRKSRIQAKQRKPREPSPKFSLATPKSYAATPNYFRNHETPIHTPRRQNGWS